MCLFACSYYMCAYNIIKWLTVFRHSKPLNNIRLHIKYIYMYICRLDYMYGNIFIGVDITYKLSHIHKFINLNICM